jgi:two-component system response regulator AtoC
MYDMASNTDNRRKSAKKSSSRLKIRQMSDQRDSILIVDDDLVILDGLEALLSDDWIVHTASTGRQALAAFAEFSPDVVVLDINLPDISGIDLLRQLKRQSELTPVVMISGVGTFERVVESMKLGADTFLAKPFEYDTFALTLEQCKKTVATKRELLAFHRGDTRRANRLPGISRAIKQLNEVIQQVARVQSPVLIIGESGSGKGVLGRLLHDRSPRARGSFVDLNCAGLTTELLESELFGHERGAFTNALATKLGLFEIAMDGTLFLDEIAEMDLSIQARLLKAVEEKRFRRVGGVRDIQTNFRLVVSTNRDLVEETARGRFRSDLYYRLSVAHLRIPPLRERPEDIPILTEEILPALAKEMGRQVPVISRAAMKKLMEHPWPGNIRELRNTLERTLLTMRGNEILTNNLALEPNSAPLLPVGPSSLPRQEWEVLPLDTVIQNYVAATVDVVGGNIRKAARLLRISPSTLYARLKDAQQS